LAKSLIAAFDTHAAPLDKGRAVRRYRGPTRPAGTASAEPERTDQLLVLNIHARASISKALEPMGRALAGAGVSPNVITTIGTAGVVAGAIVVYPQGWFFGGTLVITAFVLLDMVDGAVARAGGTASPFGGVLDSTGDRAADAAVFGALAWYFSQHDQRWLLLAALLCLVLGSLTSYIRARAESAGFNATVGIAERAERLIIVLVGTGLTGAPFHVPYVQAIALWLLVGLSAITVVQRLTTVRRQAIARRRESVGG
jgi:CDP-diacylglycerol---glycerol-3-phosphate 3-phosphatidyltransferase